MDQAIFKGVVSQSADGKPQGNLGEVVTIAISKPDGSVDNVTAALDVNGAFDTTTTPYLCTANGTYTAIASIGAVPGQWLQAASLPASWVIGDIAQARTITLTVEVS